MSTGDYAALADRQQAFQEGYQKGYAEAEKKWSEMYAALLNDKWIPVSNGLPEEECNVLAFDKSDGAHMCWFYPDNKPGRQFSGNPFVTHWMPLPPLPPAKDAE